MYRTTPKLCSVWTLLYITMIITKWMPRWVSSTYRELECGVRPGMRVGKVPWCAGEGLFTLFLFVRLTILLLLQLTILLVQVLLILHSSSYPTFNSSLYPSLRSPLPPWPRFLFTFWSPHCQSAQPLPRKRTKQWHTNYKSRLFVHFLSLSLSRKRTKRWLTGVEHWILDIPACLPAGGKASEKNRITSGWLDNFSSVHWHYVTIWWQRKGSETFVLKIIFFKTHSSGRSHKRRMPVSEWRWQG